MITFEAPPAQTPGEALREQRNVLIEKFNAEFDRIAANVDEHPRYNKAMPKAQELLSYVGMAVERLKEITDPKDGLLEALREIVDILRLAANSAQQIADQVEIRKGSIADIPPVNWRG